MADLSTHVRALSADLTAIGHDLHLLVLQRPGLYCIIAARTAQAAYESCVRQHGSLARQPHAIACAAWDGLHAAIAYNNAYDDAVWDELRPSKQGRNVNTITKRNSIHCAE